MNSLFCRHNRFTVDCPICSKGTVLDPDRRSSRARAPSRSSGGSRSRPAGGGGTIATRVTGPYASAGPYQDQHGASYEVRLERVPGGVRLAEWAAGQIRRRAPVLQAAGLVKLLSDVRERDVLGADDGEALWSAACTEPSGEAAPHGASRGRAGEMQEELRVERVEDEQVRIGRWILRPGVGWELQEAPVMLPVKRYAEAIRAAAAAGVLAG